jgi:hypothetical protein
MTRDNHLNLNDVLKRCVSECEGAGEVLTRQLIDLALDQHGGVIETMAPQLIREALAQRFRRIMKRPTPKLGEMQILLPMEIRYLRIPEMISLPPKDAAITEEVREENCRWISTREATYDQLREHQALLAESVDRDQRRLKDVNDLCDYLAPYMDGRESSPFVPALEEIALQQIPREDAV